MKSTHWNLCFVSVFCFPPFSFAFFCLPQHFSYKIVTPDIQFSHADTDCKCHISFFSGLPSYNISLSNRQAYLFSFSTIQTCHYKKSDVRLNIFTSAPTISPPSLSNQVDQVMAAKLKSRSYTTCILSYDYHSLNFPITSVNLISEQSKTKLRNKLN